MYDICFSPSFPGDFAKKVAISPLGGEAVIRPPHNGGIWKIASSNYIIVCRENVFSRHGKEVLFCQPWPIFWDFVH